MSDQPQQPPPWPQHEVQPPKAHMQHGTYTSPDSSGTTFTVKPARSRFKVAVVMLLGLILAGVGIGVGVIVTNDDDTATESTSTLPSSTEATRPSGTIITTTLPTDPLDAAFAAAGYPTPVSNQIRDATRTLCGGSPMQMAALPETTKEAARIGFSVLCPDKAPYLAPGYTPFPAGYPKEVPLKSLPPGPQNHIARTRPGAATAVQLAPGVWTARGAATTIEQDAEAGSLVGYCSDVNALEAVIGSRGHSCW